MYIYIYIMQCGNAYIASTVFSFISYFDRNEQIIVVIILF